MKLRRFEILLPLVYNDGTEIEKEKFDQTNEELLSQFGAVTFDSVIASGHWLYKVIKLLAQLKVSYLTSEQIENILSELSASVVHLHVHTDGLDDLISDQLEKL